MRFCFSHELLTKENLEIEKMIFEVSGSKDVKILNAEESLPLRLMRIKLLVLLDHLGQERVQYLI